MNIPDEDDGSILGAVVADDQDHRFDELLIKDRTNVVAKIVMDSIQRLIIGLLILLIIALTAVLISNAALAQKVGDNSAKQQQIIDTQQAGVERSYQLRAVGCSTLVLQVHSVTALPVSCLDDNTLRYYDPNAILAAANGAGGGS